MQRAVPCVSMSPSAITKASREHPVYQGWLYVQDPRKKTFTCRFCVLDGVCFSVYTGKVDANELTGEILIRQHVLVGVKRLHFVNRGLMLIDKDAKTLYVHGNQDTAYFDQWLATFRYAISQENLRLPRLSSALIDDVVDSHATSVTGWLFVRHKVLFGRVALPTDRLYVVLTGSTLAAFKLNMEGRHADLLVQLAHVHRIASSKWIRVKTKGGSVLELRGRTEDVTSVWHERLTAVCGVDRPLASTVASTERPPLRPEPQGFLRRLSTW
ncbi:hypothetical protein Poli38472_009604 [Pythium oligandrum]|uniref:PH domain-containing protein n=1 Tax=Pythium oligandrum TaxID=41045 RepID=A0A8K1CFX6_PYTOL|nr:hypothetical protein Poli38472_009604 [Pythium oligandrum]|eukprot:TMW62111.1 hypothetical protein Poli38472_009604 [Pythium oligandrum]